MGSNHGKTPMCYDELKNACLYCFKFLHFLSLVNELHTYATKKMYKFWYWINEIFGNANKGQGFKFKRQESPHFILFYFYKRKSASLFTLRYMLSYTFALKPFDCHCYCYKYNNELLIDIIYFLKKCFIRNMISHIYMLA
jgi:hypothetical protein